MAGKINYFFRHCHAGLTARGRFFSPVLLVFLLCLAGCAGASRDIDVVSGPAMECAVYARLHSTVKITGDAYTWWAKAAPLYERGYSPRLGAVLVLHDYAGPKRAHLAVVRAMVSSREIRVDHANWLNDGAIFINNPVRDVSPDNDWSQVRVWNIRSGAWGTRIYSVQGFIGPDPVSAGRAWSWNDAPGPPRG